MHGVASDALDLKHLEGCVWPHGYISDIRGLTATLWKDDGVMEDDLQNNTFRMGNLGTLPRWFLGCLGLEEECVDYGCL